MPAGICASDGRWFNAVGPGPTRRGQQTTLTAAPRSVTWHVTGRLLDAAGKPVAAFRGHAFVYRQVGWFMRSFETDADGTFRLTAEVTDDTGGAVRFEFRAQGMLLDTGKPAAVSDVTNREGGTMKLGDLTMRREPRLLRARVVDALGQPVAGLQMYAAPTHLNHGGIDSLVGPPTHQAETDADGRFTFYEAQPASGALRISTRSSDWRLVQPAQVTIGSNDEVLRVRPICSPTAHVQNPLMANILTAELVRAGRSRGRQRRANRGKFRFPVLDPGVYQLRLRLADREVLRIENIQVQPGVDADPRLSDIDWLSRTRIAELLVTAADGQPLVADVRVFDGVQSTPPAKCDAAGKLRIPFLAEQHLRVTHPLYRSRRVEPVELAGGRAIELRLLPRARLRLKLPTRVALPVGTRIVIDEDEHHVIWRHGGPTTVRPPTTGKTVLTVAIYDEHGRLHELHRQAVSLRDDDQVTDVMLDIDAEIATEAAAIAEAVREMRRRGG